VAAAGFLDGDLLPEVDPVFGDISILGREEIAQCRPSAAGGGRSQRTMLFGTRPSRQIAALR
jgi:hypothetical protein